MPEGLHVSLEGDRELVRTLKEAADQMGDFSHVNADAAEIIIGVVRPLTPVDTGYLQDSTEASVDELAVTIVNELDYAPPIHNGWPDHNIAPTPFLEEGFEESVDKWLPLYMDRVRDIIEDVEGA
jgi:hypothetical protein